MQDISTIVTIVSTLSGLAFGYFVGHRNGQVRGELSALKSMSRERRSNKNRERSESVSSAEMQFS